MGNEKFLKLCKEIVADYFNKPSDKTGNMYLNGNEWTSNESIVLGKSYTIVNSSSSTVIVKCIDNDGGRFTVIGDY